jgi:hypothetical protein
MYSKEICRSLLGEDCSDIRARAIHFSRLRVNQVMSSIDGLAHLPSLEKPQ